MPDVKRAVRRRLVRSAAHGAAKNPDTHFPFASYLAPARTPDFLADRATAAWPVTQFPKSRQTCIAPVSEMSPPWRGDDGFRKVGSHALGAVFSPL